MMLKPIQSKKGSDLENSRTVCIDFCNEWEQIHLAIHLDLTSNFKSKKAGWVSRMPWYRFRKDDAMILSILKRVHFSVREATVYCRMIHFRSPHHGTGIKDRWICSDLFFSIVPPIKIAEKPSVPGPKCHSADNTAVVNRTVFGN